MNKKDLKKLLEEVCGLHQYLNLLDSSESNPNMTLTVGVWRHNDDDKIPPHAIYVIPCYDDGEGYYQDLMSSILISNPWEVGEKASQKYIRKILAANAKGREGLLDLLEKKNAALRRYLWEEVIEDQNP